MDSILQRALDHYARGGEKEKLIEALTSVAARDERVHPACFPGGSEAAEFELWVAKSQTADEGPQHGEIQALLAAQDEQLDEILGRLDQRYRFRICGQLRRTHPYLTAWELGDVWQDTLVLISRRAMQRRLNPSQSFGEMAWRTARRCARDLVSCHVGGVSDVWDTSEEPELGGELQRRWRLLTVLQQEEVLELMCLAIKRLPPQEKALWEAYLRRCAGESRALDLVESAGTLNEHTDEPDAADALAQTLDLVRSKIHRFLRRNGYDLSAGQVADSAGRDRPRQAGGEAAGCLEDPLDQLSARAYFAAARQEHEALSDLTGAEGHLTAPDRAVLENLGPDLAQLARSEYPTRRTWNSALWSDRYTHPETRLQETTVVQEPEEAEPTLDELIPRYHKILDEKRLDWAPHSRLTALLGEGGQGVVYLLRSPGSDGFRASLALKIFAPDRYASPRSYVADTRRMARTASIVASLHSEHLLDVGRFERQDGVRMMLMEWIDGYDLCQLMAPEILKHTQERTDPRRWTDINRIVVTAGRKQPKFRPGVAVAIMRCCLKALKLMHAAGIVHGDIKPSNIMANRNGNVKLIDIGSAFTWKEFPQAHHCTYEYAAPEVLDGDRYTPQSDLASLGYVLIELLAGCPLFERVRSGEALLEAKRSLPSKLGDLLPEEVRSSKALLTLCRRLVEPDPAQRFLSARHADLDSECGAHTFLNQLAEGKLSTAYDDEIHLWLGALN